MNNRIFANKLYKILVSNTVIPLNKKTAIAVAANIMYNDFMNNNKLMESNNIVGEINSIILMLSKLNKSNGLIDRMNENNNMFECIKVFSTGFYGEIHPENTLTKKMCYVSKVEDSIK